VPELPLFFPEQASTSARSVDAITIAALVVSVVFSVLIAVLIVVFAVRYRRRSPGQAGTRTRDSLALEATWSAIPLGIMLGLYGWGARVYVEVNTPPPDASEYFVVGKRWMWKIQHPQGRREINTLHVPVGTRVRLTMTSEDVIHSFFVPAFRVKQDVLPGRYSSLWFEPTRTGTYDLFCAEYCGTEHSLMGGEVVVMEPDAYERWLTAGPATASMAEDGESLFRELACHTCHAAGDSARGPSLRGLYGSTVTLAGGRTVVADDAYLRESIVDPAAKLVAGYEPLMPTYRGQIDEEALMRLVTYLRELGDGSATETDR